MIPYFRRSHVLPSSPYLHRWNSRTREPLEQNGLSVLTCMWFSLSGAVTSRCRYVSLTNGTLGQESQDSPRTGCYSTDHRNLRGPLQHRSPCYVRPRVPLYRRWLLVWRFCKSRVSPLQWRYNGHDGVPNHQHHDCILNRLFRRRSKIKVPRHWPLCGEFTGDRRIPRTKGQWRGKCFHLMTSTWLQASIPMAAIKLWMWLLIPLSFPSSSIIGVCLVADM